MLTFGAATHASPVVLRPAMAPYTISLDAISKSFAGTGLRVGWVLGPPDVVRRMGDFLTHVGTWAPRPEQVATAALLSAGDAVSAYNRAFRDKLRSRLERLAQGLAALRERGLPVDCTTPGGAMYLSARFALAGRPRPGGGVFATNEDIRVYLLDEADFAAVPFQAFGVPDDTGWFRLSVGAVSEEAIERVLPKLAAAVERIAEQGGRAVL